MSSVINWFKELDKNKQILLGLIVIMSILGGLTLIMKSWSSNKEKTWDYSTNKISYEIISSGKLIYDRQTYWQLDDIIFQYVNSYIYNQDENTKKIAKAPYKEYYNALTKDYKKVLNKNEYVNKSEMFFNKILLETESPSGFYEENKNRISKVLLYDNNMYLCEIEGLDKNFPIVNCYIGIKLDSSSNKFSIFYIE